MSEERIAKLERELAELKAQLKPPPAEQPPAAREPWKPIDWTEGFRLPASAAKAMADVVPDVRGGKFNQHAWSQTKVAEPGGFGGPEKPQPSEALKPGKGSGWAEPVPLETPSGVKWCDQQMDVADALDRRDLRLRLRRL